MIFDQIFKFTPLHISTTISNRTFKFQDVKCSKIFRETGQQTGMIITTVYIYTIKQTQLNCSIISVLQIAQFTTADSKYSAVLVSTLSYKTEIFWENSQRLVTPKYLNAQQSFSRYKSSKQLPSLKHQIMHTLKQTTDDK